jgi:DNA-binding CsgD family transcriptional regulator
LVVIFHSLNLSESSAGPSGCGQLVALGSWNPYVVRRIVQRAVPALARGDAERLLRFVAEAESFGGDPPFCGDFLTQLGRLVPADWVGYTDRPRGATDDPLLHFARPGDEGVYSGIDWAAVMPVVEAECPVFRHFRRRSFAALKTSDVVSRRELYRTPTYDLVFEPLGLTDSLELRLRVGPPARTTKFGFDRIGRDFSARDRDVLDLLHPHFVRLYRASESRRRLREALVLHESTRAAVVFLEADDRIGFASTAARELLDRYFGQTRVLPDSLASWLRERRRTATDEPFRVDVGDRSLVVELVDGGLLLEERRQMPRLTPREREILDLVAEGRTNAEIAGLLWVSPGTVRKHLDNVYAKLGVHTRTAAAAFVRERRLPPRDA